jgi:hypothetical protein
VSDAETRAGLDAAGRELERVSNGHASHAEAAAAVAAFLNAPPPTASTIRLYLGEVSSQSMRDIYAYHRWLAATLHDMAKGEKK